MVFFNPGHKAQRRASTSDCRGMNFYISWKSITYTPGKKNIGASQICLVPGCTGHPKIIGLPPKIVITHDVPWAPFWAVLLSLISRSTRLEKWAACTVKHYASSSGPWHWIRPTTHRSNSRISYDLTSQLVFLPSNNHWDCVRVCPQSDNSDPTTEKKKNQMGTPWVPKILTHIAM